MVVKKKDKGHKKTKNGKSKKEPKIDPKIEVEYMRNPAMEKLFENASRENEQYKVRIETLIKTIDNLQETCRTQDHDALEIISSLQKESESKDTKIKLLEGQMDNERETARLEKESIIRDYENQISDLKEVLREKETSLKVIKDEFNVLKDFRRKRRELMQELERKNNDMIEIEKTNKDKIDRLEKKFFEEKVRLQKETNKKLSELASKAHEEAILNLKQTTKEVYKENLRMADALRYHVMEGEGLQKLNNQLSVTNKQLLEEKDLNSIIVKEKIMQSKKQNDQIKELQNKVISMEYTLSHIVREFDQEKEMISKLAKQEIDKVRCTVDTLKSELDIRIKQMKQIRRIAQHILDQRTDLETFFMDALDHVKIEICHEREERRRREAEEYNRKIKNVLKSHDTNDAESLNKEVEEQKLRVKKNANKIDITQLSWKDKERVLRILFAKMNGIAMQGSDGNEENKISSGDYQMDENSKKQKDDDEEGSEYTENSEEEKEGGEEEDVAYDSNIEYISDIESIDMIEEMRKQEKEKDSDQLILDSIRNQQLQKNVHESNIISIGDRDSKENIVNEFPSPHPPLNEPQNKDIISRNKKRSNSSLSHSNSRLLMQLNNNDTNIITTTTNNSDNNNNMDSNEATSPIPPQEVNNSGSIKATTKEIMKSDESLNKFIEDGIKDCHKSEEELKAQSMETFDEFLKRSMSKVNEGDVDEKNEDHKTTEYDTSNITEAQLIDD
ncbi:hypothetical protein BCR36DRAFT_582486 [Piromyces finnis]|uniref:Basal body-orientation factor 1 n=1 Tax=Piromyces finnis TaxID=1754191 RepID=A0A1Y1VCZ2_9FUNG|nr:hypothetical protein BCR36DRAFT_582486 [Piromyces finnis]|eukprot:ORX52538.1 hypothetical protein BCR36DRAFT_582486 [Piromyces finnis]